MFSESPVTLCWHVSLFFRKKEGAKRVRYTITVLHQGTPVRVSAIASTSKAAKAAAAKAVLEKIGKT